VSENGNHYRDEALAIAKSAGEAIAEIVRSGQGLQIEKKADQSPLTLADKTAHHLIETRLQSAFPAIPVISEESDLKQLQARRQWSTCWVVDPLDGTRGFIHGSKEYCVNIALVVDHKPVVGVLSIPEHRVHYFASKGGGAFVQYHSEEPVLLQRTPPVQKPIRVLIGQYHKPGRVYAALADQMDIELVRLNSAWKFGWLAEGKADVYPRLGPTSEWDSAAGQCILEEVGGRVVDFSGHPLQYNARDTLLNPEFIAISNPTMLDQILAAFSNVRRDL